MPVIRVERLTKDYGHQRGVFDISFHVEKGEVFGFLGPNGAGKTTAIRHIMGFIRPQKGSAYVQGLNSWEHAREIQKNLGYLPGEISLPGHHTGMQFLRMMAELRGLNDFSRAQYLMETFELDPAGSVKRMPLGTKRKLAIVAAFMHDPGVLVLDEPTSGLDPVMQKVFIDFILEEKKRGKTILLSSHIFHEVEAACDRISIIREGRVVSAFSADELRYRKEKTYELEFESREEYERFRSGISSFKEYKELVWKPEKKQMEIRIDDRDINAFVRHISQYRLKFFAEIPFTLEDYFMKFYDREDAGEGGAASEPH